jgi:hypothetical protein
MRTWGRVGQVGGLGGTWTEVTTDTNGENGAVYLTDLIQVLRLNLGESPFFANYGIPAEQSVLQQVQPDYYAARAQRQFAPFFATLVLTKQAAIPNQQPLPTYNISVTTLSGAIVTGPIPV